MAGPRLARFAVIPSRAGRNVHAVALIHAAATLAMVGVAWFVQVVHYPLFAFVGGDFPAYEERHANRTTVVVAPLMTVEAATALLLLATRPGVVTVAGVCLLGLIWISTAALQVPCHRLLGRGFDRGVHDRLLATSWLRTAAWTVRGGLALALVA
jgi:hypothetical protein